MIYIALVCLCLITAVIGLGWRFYIKTVEKNEWGEILTAKQYSRHYIMLPEETSATLWQDIYASAREAAAEADAYVELFDGWSTEEYTTADYIDIAIAAKADGIIVKPDGTQRVRDAINAASEAGIPVVTVLADDIESSRKSFVGINGYQMGTIYGRQVLACIGEDTRRITVLLGEHDSGKDFIFKELKSTVQSGLSKEQKERIEIEPVTIRSGSTFEAEEAIRDLFNAQERPDILVCMNETDSVCAYHAMVDYNQVGDIDIIGFYESETMLNAVRKGTVPMVITLDTQQVGRSSIEALEEYHSMGYASNYFSVDLAIITQENAEKFSGASRR